MIWTECVPVTWDLNLCDAYPLTMLRTLEIFQNGIFESKVLQVSSDGPNVNLAFLKRYASMQDEKELDPFMELGNYGLGIVQYTAA